MFNRRRSSAAINSSRIKSQTQVMTPVTHSDNNLKGPRFSEAVTPQQPLTDMSAGKRPISALQNNIEATLSVEKESHKRLLGNKPSRQSN